jgi:thymidylate kinase
VTSDGEVATHGQGRFVVLVGPDGVGKTAVARALVARHRGPSGYFHFLPPVGRPLAAVPEQGATPPAKASGGGSRILGWFRLFKNAGWCWIGYLSTIRPALQRNWLVVGDRWMYGYLVQPGALKFYGPGVLSRMVMRLLPHPDLVVNLTAPPDVIRARKEELSIAEIERELPAWRSLRTGNFRTLDATRPPCEIAGEILAILAARRRAG